MSANGTRGTSEAISGFVVCGLGLAWVWIARDYGLLGDGGRLEAGTLPAVAGVVLAACGLAVLVRAAVQRSGAEPGAQTRGETVEPAAEPAADFVVRRKAVVVFGALLCSLLVAPHVGFMVSFGILTFLMLSVVERKPLLVSAASALVMWGFGYFCFEVFLQVPLPQPVLLNG